MRNKLTALLIGSILVVASGTAAAGGNVSFGISIGVPAYYPAYTPPPVAYYPAAPVYYSPPAVYYSPRPFYGPATVVRFDRGHHRGHHRGWGNGHRDHFRHR
jgi:hypothetical protein